MARMPDPLSPYDDSEIVWSDAFPDAVGVKVGTNLWDRDNEHERVPDVAPIRVGVTTEDGTGDAYLTIDDAKQLVNLLGNAISKALRQQGRA